MAFRHRGRRRLLPKMAFRGSITRPAHLPAYASAMGSPPTPQDLGFPGRIPPGVGLASDVYSPSAHLLPPAGLPALSLCGQSLSRERDETAYRARAAAASRTRGSGSRVAMRCARMRAPGGAKEAGASSEAWGPRAYESFAAASVSRVLISCATPRASTSRSEE